MIFRIFHLRVVFSIFSFLILVSPVGPAHAAEPLDGQGCSTAGAFVRSGGPEVGGGGHFLVCDGSTWNRFLGYNNDGVAIFTHINQGSCADGDQVTYDAATGGLRCGNP